MSETQRLKEDEDPEVSVEAPVYLKDRSTRQWIRDLFRNPANAAAVVIIAVLVCISIVSGIAYFHRTQNHQVARFIVISDYGTDNTVQDAVARQLEQTAHENNVRFVLSLGNNFYDSGVNSTSDSGWITKWYNVYYDKHPLDVPWYALLGDVDYKGNVSVQLEYTSPITDGQNMWQMPDKHYAIKLEVEDADPLYLLLLDTSGFVHPNGAGGVSPLQSEQLQNEDGSSELEWLRSMLHAYADQDVVVAGHHPVHLHVDTRLGTAGGRYEQDLANRGMAPLEHLMKNYSVQAYLSGHVPVMDYSSHDGIDYFVAGTGGCSETVPNPCTVDGATVVDSSSEFASRQAGFLLVEVDEYWMDFSFINSVGMTVYKTTRHRREHDNQGTGEL